MGAAFLLSVLAKFRRRRRGDHREVHGTIAHGHVRGEDGRRYGAGTQVNITIEEHIRVASVAGRLVPVIGHVGMARNGAGSNYLATFPAGTLDEHAVVLLIEDSQQAAWLSTQP
jgi:hypothetical protein